MSLLRDTNNLLPLSQWAVAALLLGLMLPCLAFAYVRVWRVWSESTRSQRLLLAAAIAVAAVLRWAVAPRWIATVFLGYRSTARAIQLFPILHYGMGVQAFFHLVFQVLPADHRTLMWVDSVIGVLTLPLIATFAARLLGRLEVGLWSAWLVALTPMFIRNDNSDANNVPLLWWMFAGLVLWEEYLDGGERLAALAALPLLALTAIARPEFPFLLLFFVPAMSWVLRAARPVWRDRPVVITAVAAGLLLIPQLLNSLHFAEDMDAAHRGWWSWASDAFIQLNHNGVAHPLIFPSALLALGALGVVLPGGDWRARLLLVVAVVAELVLSGGDVHWANMARVHVPPALFVVLLAALAATKLRTGTRARALRLGLLGAFGVAFVLTAIPTARMLWAPTNEQQEEEFIQTALGRLPAAAPLLFLRPGQADQPGNETHMDFPDYLLQPPRQVSSLTPWLEDPDADQPVYFFQGMRCYARKRDELPPTMQPKDPLQPACARLRREFTLTPVIEQSVPNRGNVWLNYYGPEPELTLGLYRVGPRL